MAKFKICNATPADIDVLSRHRQSMFREMVKPTKEELRVMDRSYRRWVLRLMKAGLLHGYIVNTSRGRPAASGCVWLRETQPAPGRPATLTPYVLSMYTEPEFRRNGLASMIIEEATKWGRKKGYHKMVLHASKVGRKVYAKLGWERTWEMEYYFE